MAQVSIKSWNPRFVQRWTRQFLTEFGPVIGRECQLQIRYVKWYWPAVTYRKNGQVVEVGNRDIVDTETLVHSQTRPLITMEDGSVKLKIKWTAPYSQKVLEGGYLVGSMTSNYRAPERNWIGAAIKETDPLAYIQRRFNKLSTYVGPPLR